MTYEDAARAYDNESPEDYEPAERCPDCDRLKCVCDNHQTDGDE